jgi:hypothetical protein
MIALFVFSLDYQNYGILKMGLPKPTYWHNFLIVNDGYDIFFILFGKNGSDFP